jgi:replicative DNA helicase
VRKKPSLETPDRILTGMVMPQAVELEEAVLGAIINEGRLFNDVCDTLKPTDFYLSANQ